MKIETLHENLITQSIFCAALQKNKEEWKIKHRWRKNSKISVIVGLKVALNIATNVAVGALE